MGIFDRLGNVIRSYINDEDDRIFGKAGRRSFSGDGDLDEAFEELDEFLSGGRDRWGARGPGNRGPGSGPEPAGPAGRSGVPEALKADFAVLGLEPEASAEECKAAYKRLLKLHHPDRHAGHAGNMKKATEKSARINAAYDRIEKWRRGDRTE